MAGRDRTGTESRYQANRGQRDYCALLRAVFGGGELAHVAGFLESYWDFDAADGDGRVPDRSPIGNHHGELLNGAVLTSGTQGHGGSGEALDPSVEENARMEANMPEGYDFNGPFTWSAWVKIFEEAGAGDPFGKGEVRDPPVHGGRPQPD